MDLKIKGLFDMSADERVEVHRRFVGCRDAPSGTDVYNDQYCRINGVKQYGCKGCTFNMMEYVKSL